ncbi:MAG TPA: TIGR03557 family F420-dependent LLM class oxidoreductase [Gaiellaceae bacterium]|jgi:G6PDH family F420-dependent oxidoreductase
MVEVGYALSSEELGPAALVENAARAEQAGFRFALISDHFHPWIDEQGESPFVWSTIGAISQATESLAIGTGVTCPLIRIHPAVIAHAAATTAALMPGRFFLGVGTGENLNEHVLGDRWPNHDERAEMLEEAVALMRELWQGGLVTHRGDHYTVDRARLYTVPEEPPPVAVAAAGPEAAELAGRIGDALVSTAPDEELVQAFRDAGGDGKPCYGQLTVCYAEDRDEAVQTAFEQWPNAGLGGELGQELAMPSHYRAAAEVLTPEQVAEKVVCGPDPEEHREAIAEFERAGFSRVYVHQVGHDQEPFFQLYERELLPALQPVP